METITDAFSDAADKIPKEYCGPYISDGKFQSSVCGYLTPSSLQEYNCKVHDCCYYNARSKKHFKDCDKEFYLASLNNDNYLQGYAVYYGGSNFHSNDYTKQYGYMDDNYLPPVHISMVMTLDMELTMLTILILLLCAPLRHLKRTNAPPTGMMTRILACPVALRRSLGFVTASPLGLKSS